VGGGVRRHALEAVAPGGRVSQLLFRVRSVSRAESDRVRVRVRVHVQRTVLCRSVPAPCTVPSFPFAVGRHCGWLDAEL
jgi:hypothetical protein